MSNRLMPPLAMVMALAWQPVLAARYSWSADSDLVGQVLQIPATHEDTLIDMARAGDVGYEEVRWSNPKVDPWMPGAGNVVTLPTQHLLPQAPRTGLVLNLPEMRLFYYPVNEPGVVYSYPVGVGRMDWRTPLGTTRVVDKKANPTWYPPDSIIREHAENGDPLPKAVPPGPDNPLGLFALKLGIPAYLIHGTNKAYGIGMRVTHGCVRLYPEDIEALFPMVPVGTAVTLVSEAVKAGRSQGVPYLEVHPPLEEDRESFDDGAGAASRALAGAGISAAEVDWELIRAELLRPSGLPIPVPKLPISARMD